MGISDDVRLPIGRGKMPHWAVQEREALARLRGCTLGGDIPGGVQAMADWVDARCAITVFALFHNDVN